MNQQGQRMEQGREEQGQRKRQGICIGGLEVPGRLPQDGPR